MKKLRTNDSWFILLGGIFAVVILLSTGCGQIEGVGDETVFMDIEAKLVKVEESETSFGFTYEWTVELINTKSISVRVTVEPHFQDETGHPLNSSETGKIYGQRHVVLLAGQESEVTGTVILSKSMAERLHTVRLTGSALPTSWDFQQ